MSEEIWKPVFIDGESWPYEVSNKGRVRRVKAARGARKGYVLKPYHNVYTRKQLSEEYGVSESAINNVVDGKSWKDVK